MPEQRPNIERLISVNPALHESNTNIPVTPAGDESGRSAYFEPTRDSPSPTWNPKSTSSAPYWNANTPRGHGDKRQGPSDSDAQNGEELLRRLSLTGQRSQQPDPVDVDPRAAHPSLNLSGHVISATFCVPYDIAHSAGNEWVSLGPHSLLFERYRG